MTDPIYHLFTKQQILGLSKLKAFADDKISVNQKLMFDLGRIENTVGKGGKLVFSIFSFSKNAFKSFLFEGHQVDPFPNDKFLDSSKHKMFVDDNFKFDENGRTLSK